MPQIEYRFLTDINLSYLYTQLLSLTKRPEPHGSGP